MQFLTLAVSAFLCTLSQINSEAFNAQATADRLKLTLNPVWSDCLKQEVDKSTTNNVDLKTLGDCAAEKNVYFESLELSGEWKDVTPVFNGLNTEAFDNCGIYAPENKELRYIVLVKSYTPATCSVNGDKFAAALAATSGATCRHIPALDECAKDFDTCSDIGTLKDRIGLNIKQTAYLYSSGISDEQSAVDQLTSNLGFVPTYVGTACVDNVFHLFYAA